MELWWPGKFPEYPWIHVESSWIMFVMFNMYHNFVILNLISTIFCHWPGSYCRISNS